MAIRKKNDNNKKDKKDINSLVNVGSNSISFSKSKFRTNS
jgi:hypothetical protein